MITLTREEAQQVLDLLKTFHAKLSEPEPDLRKLLKIRQAAWKDVRSEYKDDPECCFALGFDAGYDAVAQRVEPPVKESGEGFESLPASPIAWMTFNAYGEEDDIWYVEPKGDLPEGWTYKPLYDTPSKKKWVNLTVEERETLRNDYEGSVSGLISAVQMMLKEKNT